MKYDVAHPVINDCDFNVWGNFNINSWPSIILIGPEGKVIYTKSGEGVLDFFEPFIEVLLDYYDESALNKTPLPLDLETEKYLNDKT